MVFQWGLLKSHGQLLGQPNAISAPTRAHAGLHGTQNAFVILLSAHDLHEVENGEPLNRVLSGDQALLGA